MELIYLFSYELVYHNGIKIIGVVQSCYRSGTYTVPFLYEVFKNCVTELYLDVISCHYFGVYEARIIKVYTCVSTSLKCSFRRLKYCLNTQAFL